MALLLCAVTLALVTATRLSSGGQGDAARGAAIYDGNVAICSVCHERGLAPSLTGISEQVSSVRLNMMGHRDKTQEQYLAESILYPSAYIVPPYTGLHRMPEIYSRILSLQDVQDLVAYLLTL